MSATHAPVISPSMRSSSLDPVQDHSNANASNPKTANSAKPSSSPSRLLESSSTSAFLRRLSVIRLARHTLGLFFLLVTALLYTASNFLASTIFADNSYSKPYFVTYLNSSVFSVFLVIFAFKRLWATLRSGWEAGYRGQKKFIGYSPLAQSEDQTFLRQDVEDTSQSSRGPLSHSDNTADPLLIDDCESELREELLNTRETAKLGFQFCLLLFLANYFVSAALKFTNVASVTVLTGTCGIWTLIIGALMGAEIFTLNKLIGVLTTLAGVILTSSVDLAGDNDGNRGYFPHKSWKELAVGDLLSLASAISYGVYTNVLKKKVGNEARLDMDLFLGFIGVFNTIVLFPGLVICHFSGIENFQFPPTRRIWAIVMINASISIVSDVSWIYAMLLTSPIVVTVGLSLTIPLSLVGQVVLYQQKASLLYWTGAGIVFLSFVFVNNESKRRVEAVQQDNEPGSRPASALTGASHGNSSS
ncbi:hypothetical protein MMC07_000516 [Pseudocyphellaria aurata]|nr:hypothetical protein [Pseudocyphellaria aurata]